MTYFRPLRHLVILAALILTVMPVRASDHADPVDLFNRKPQEGGLTDLFFFPRVDENGVQRMELILCVRRALTDTGTLKLEPYTYRIFMDLNSAVTFDNPEQLARYGGTVPEDIKPGITIELHLTNKAELNGQPTFEGLTVDPKRIVVQTGVFDDPFIFPTFFRTNVVAMIMSIPRDAFPANQHDWILWATSSRAGKQIDHVGRSLRTQNPRFDMLNTLPPNRHVAAIKAERANPSLMRDVFLKLNFQAMFAFRDWDEVPDVMIYSDRRPVGFPNGRKLTDDVAELLAVYGDTLLKEISYITGKQFPRATKNDQDFRLREARCTGPDAGNPLSVEERTRRCDQTIPENLAFPYLAPPWEERPQARPAALTDANRTKLWLIGLGIVAVLILTHWLYAKWYHYRLLRHKFL